MIYLVSGPPGNGKSFYAIRKVAQSLEEGKLVAGNVELAQDWPRILARRSWPFLLNPLARRRLLRDGPSRFHYTEDLEELASIRLAGRGEGRGLMVLDEGHNWMNARSWSADDRKEIVRFFSQHRKLGWDVLLVAQHPEMIDKQVRNLVEYNVFLRNLKKAKWAGVPVVPFNLFLAVWCWHSAQRVVVKREVFRLSWRKSLYDTFETTHGLDSEDGSIVLPSAPDTRGLAATTTHGRTRPGAAGRAPAAAGASVPGDEAQEEAGEPEAWPLDGDFTPPQELAG